MKTLTTLALALVLLGTTATATDSDRTPVAADPNPPAYAYQVRNADFHGWTISRGMPARTLLNKGGHPDAKLSPTIWIYRNFHAVPNRRDEPRCTTLMVTFVGGVISDLHLVNDRTEAIVAARQRDGAPALVASTP